MTSGGHADVCEHLSPVSVPEGPPVSSDSTTPDTIVLIHGFWVTPRSWEKWIEHYRSRGYRVLAPAYPGFEVEVEALNADPTPIEKLTVPEIIAHLESVISGVQTPPILIGHSAGGAFTQILLDRGFGAVGVAINSAPTEGVAVVPLSQVKASFPVLKNPANRHRRSPSRPSSGTTHSPTRSARKSPGRCTSATPSRHQAGSSGGARSPPSSPGIRTPTSTTGTTPARRCCSSPAVKTTSCRRRCSSPTPSTTSRIRSPRSRSIRARHTCSPPRRVGRRSPTTPWSGPPRTPGLRRDKHRQATDRSRAAECPGRGTPEGATLVQAGVGPGG